MTDAQYRALLHRVLLLERKHGSLAGGGGSVIPHANQHEDGGSDPIDITQLDGFPGTTTTFLRGDGAFAPMFSGALVHKAADQTAANYTTNTAIAWDAEEYDTDAWHDTVTNNTRLTVPAGKTKVRVHACVRITSFTANEWFTLTIIKNGSANYRGHGAMLAFTDAVNVGTLSVTTGVVAVTAGDYFEAFLQVESDTSITIEEERSSFSIEAVG